MPKFHALIAALALLALGLAGTGCGPRETAAFGAEADDAGYREGQQLVKQGRPQEALATYLKVIVRRGESAPESHLEAGLIYRQHIKDPIAAIYHFRKYLEQQPNSRQAPLVRQQIEAARRDFGRTLPNQPLESREVRIDGFDQRDRLERENEQLKMEVAALRSGAAGGFSAGLPPVRPAQGSEVRVPPPAEPSNSPLVLAPIPEPEPPTVNTAGPRARPTPPAPGGGRRHTVAAKDSLFGIAKKYYGTATNARVKALIDANRDVLPPDNGLKPGMELKIP